MHTPRTMLRTAAIVMLGVALPLAGAAAAAAAIATESTGPDAVTGEDLAQAERIPYRQIDETPGSTQRAPSDYEPEATRSVIEARSMPYMWIANAPRSPTGATGAATNAGVGAPLDTATVADSDGLSASQWWLVAAGAALLAALAVTIQQRRHQRQPSEARDARKVR